MKVADHVITCTPYLDEFVRKYNKNTTDISSTVDTDRYQPVNNYTNDKRVIIGWSGSLTTSRFLMTLKDVLQRVTIRYNIEVLVMGDSTVKMENVCLKGIPWTEKDEMSTLQKFDIGIYPLPDEEWVYGKSGLKAIQYMALGIPTVATAIGTIYRVIDNGVSGFLVKTDDEWIETLGKLIEDASLRKKIGMAGRRKVEEMFSVEANKGIYLKILNSICAE